jgi:sterol 3beta-glucosyltransferase
MILLVSGHEEVFFEFGDVRKRDLVKECCEARLDNYRNSVSSPDVSLEHTTEEEQAAALKALEVSVKSPIFTEAKSEELSPIMFNSSTSSFVTLKPKKPLHSKTIGLVLSTWVDSCLYTVTCLTVGSRGDVQPYIALCIGLKKDGHRCRIASHPEYREWIEAYGIEFSAVGGDPAELMKCVDMLSRSLYISTSLMIQQWAESA